MYERVLQSLESNPIIAAVQSEYFDAALSSPAEIIFHLSADLMSIPDIVAKAHAHQKLIFIHIDLAEGVGKDRMGVHYISKCGADGIISTKAQLIRYAKEKNLVAVQRFFALDSKGMESIGDMLKSSNPHLMEIMPGVIGKAICRFSSGSVPVIAGGLIQTKSEVMDALKCGATAVSTGKSDLWYI